MSCRKGARAPRCRPWVREANGLLVFSVFLLLVVVPVQAQEGSSGASPAPGEEFRPPDEAVSGDYRIGVEDVLSIHVWEDESLQAGITVAVRPDGWITFPYVENEIHVAGRTPIELRDEIRDRLSDYVPNATVTVMVSAMNSFKFYIIGEVNNQGVIQVGSRIRVLHALALAGGLTEFADKDKLILVREGEAGEERYRLDYKKILEGDVEHNLWIRPGDTLIAY